MADVISERGKKKLVYHRTPREREEKKRKYKDLDARLKTIVEDFANRDILDFLRGIAHDLQFVQ